MSRERYAIAFPEPGDITMAVVHEMDGYQTFFNISKGDLADEVAKYGFDSQKIEAFLSTMAPSHHTVVFDIEQMREDGKYY